MLLGYGFASKVVVEGRFVHEDSRAPSNLRKTSRGTAIAAIGEFEASGKGERDRLSAPTMRDGTADQIGKTSSVTNSRMTVQERLTYAFFRDRGSMNIHLGVCRDVESDIGAIPLEVGSAETCFGNRY